MKMMPMARSIQSTAIAADDRGPQGTPCNLQLNQYSTRCQCHNHKSQCSQKSRYKTVKTLSEVGQLLHPYKTGTKRQREHYDNQQFPVKGTKVKKLMEQAGESVATGSTSSLEMIAIAQIVQKHVRDR